MLFLQKPQSKNLPMYLFRKDRCNWATRTRSILANHPSTGQNPFQTLLALPMRAPDQQNHLILLYCFQRHGPSNTLYHLVRDVKKVRTLPAAGRRLGVDCFLCLESACVLHELPEYFCTCQAPHFRAQCVYMSFNSDVSAYNAAAVLSPGSVVLDAFTGDSVFG